MNVHERWPAKVIVKRAGAIAPGDHVHVSLRPYPSISTFKYVKARAMGGDYVWITVDGVGGIETEFYVHSDELLLVAEPE